MAGENPLDEEELEPLTLKPLEGSAKNTAPGKAILLALLLGGWAWSVAWFFEGRDSVPNPKPIPGTSTPQPDGEPEAPLGPEPSATPTPTPRVEATATAVPLRNLTLISDPPGATILRNGRFEGVAPLELQSLREGELLALRLPGYRNASLRISTQTGELRIPMEPLLGQVRVLGFPDQGELRINGELQVLPEGGLLELPLQEQEVEVRHPDGRVEQQRVSPAEAYVKELRFDFAAPEEQLPPTPTPRPSFPNRIRTKQGVSLRRVEASLDGWLGSARNEAGRMANETRRQVRFQRAFVVAEREVSNQEFRAFRAEHDSGRVQGVDLNLDDLPVVRVTPRDAMQYCNWLSRQEGLPPAYEERDGQWVFVPLPGTGYRLPTEAEWERIARGGQDRVYFWGDRFPPPDESLNIAGVESQGLLNQILRGYRDNGVGPQAVGEAPKTAFEFRGLGGNVREWVLDRYGIPPRSSKAELDPWGPERGNLFVIKGGGWQSHRFQQLRCARREYGKSAAPDLGFRVARYLE